jgi:ABC-type thiamine transport system ATPase subunit
MNSMKKCLLQCGPVTLLDGRASSSEPVMGKSMFKKVHTYADHNGEAQSKTDAWKSS